MNTRQEILNKKKPTRTTTSRRNILTVNGLTDTDEYVYRWVNDVDDRIPNLLEDGYVFVDKKGLTVGDQTIESARGTTSVMRKGVGGGVVAYLMKIPKDIYDAYKDELRRENAQLMATMKQDAGPDFTGSISVERK